MIEMSVLEVKTITTTFAYFFLSNNDQILSKAKVTDLQNFVLNNNHVSKFILVLTHYNLYVRKIVNIDEGSIVCVAAKMNWEIDLNLNSLDLEGMSFSSE